MSLAGRRIAFIGGGAMAEALAGGLIAGGVSASQIRIAEPLPERCAQLRDRLGVAAGADYADAVRDSDLVVLAVKPGVVPTALAALRAEDPVPTTCSALPGWLPHPSCHPPNHPLQAAFCHCKQ